MPSAVPTGTLNTTDHDSRIVRTTGEACPAGLQRAGGSGLNHTQIIVAAEITIDSPDFGHLEPMVDAVERELAAIGVSELPRDGGLPILGIGTSSRWRASSVAECRC